MKKAASKKRASAKAPPLRLKAKAPPPFPFVLDLLESIELRTKPMFGCLALYQGEKIVLILRDKQDHPRDSGVWIATVPEHHASLQKDFPSMRSIEIFGPGPTAWQNLPSDSPDFEESVERVCRMVLRSDPRVGKVPQGRRKKKR
ncbi:MAG: hypothetical protein IT285_00645 [Bdellovibrionales bacterium]|nr:hypothetical protein [Bdellovibrionales bacterium]